MRDITLKELLEAGCHFGHQTNRWHPKATDYIYSSRENVHIIDLARTKQGLEKAAAFLKDLAKNGGSIIFVGTKRQARGVVEENSKKIREIGGTGDTGETKNFYYLLERWPGGLLTNFEVIKKNNLDAIVRLHSDIEKDLFVTKKEKILAQRKHDKYERVFGGLVGLGKLPDAVFFIDIRKEAGAIKEALRTGVKIVAIVDTNVDPAPIDYQIPANDDAVGSLQIIVDYLTEAWREGLSQMANSEPETNSKDKDSHSQTV